MTEDAVEQADLTPDLEQGAHWSEYWEQDYDYKRPKQGDLVMGIILEVRPEAVLIDIGAKRDGFVSARDLGRLDNEILAGLSVGDEVPVFVLSSSNSSGELILSLSKGRELDEWHEAERLLEADEVLELQVSGYNSGGVTVTFGQLIGFVPASHLVGYARGMSDQDKGDWLGSLPGKVLRLKLLEVSQPKRRLVLSQRKAERVYRRQRREELLENLAVGDVVSGKVSSLAGFGAFVDIGGADGLVHISEISHEMVNDPKEVLKIGQEVRVRVIKLDPERERIGLSIKQLQPSPWDEIYTRLFAGQVVPATIVNVAPFGAFARIEAGLVGLIHVSRLTDRSVSHPSEVVSSGDEVTVRVVGIDAGRQRIALSMRDVPQGEATEDVVVDWVVGDEQQEDTLALEDTASEDDDSSGHSEDLISQVAEAL